MNELTTEIIAALAQKQDLDEVFRHHLELTPTSFRIINGTTDQWIKRNFNDPNHGH